MTPRELAIIQAFKSVTFPLASRRKRFALNMIALAEHDPNRTLTESQARYLTALAFQFRRQMPADLAYPVIDDGSHMARDGFEVSRQAPIARPASPKKKGRRAPAPFPASCAPQLTLPLADTARPSPAAGQLRP